MLATLHLPDTAPRVLTDSEAVAVNVHRSSDQHLVVASGDLTVRQLLAMAHDYEVMANGPAYIVLVTVNAEDFDLPVNLSATAEVTRLTGVDFDEEPLLGPVLIIEA